MKLKTSIVENNGVVYLRLPSEGKDWINLQKGDEPFIQLEEKTKGKFISVFLEGK